jgi:hypothetical protein
MAPQRITQKLYENHKKFSNLGVSRPDGNHPARVVRLVDVNPKGEDQVGKLDVDEVVPGHGCPARPRPGVRPPPHPPAGAVLPSSVAS